MNKTCTAFGLCAGLRALAQRTDEELAGLHDNMVAAVDGIKAAASARDTVIAGLVAEDLSIHADITTLTSVVCATHASSSLDIRPYACSPAKAC